MIFNNMLTKHVENKVYHRTDKHLKEPKQKIHISRNVTVLLKALQEIHFISFTH